MNIKERFFCLHRKELEQWIYGHEYVKGPKYNILRIHWKTVSLEAIEACDSIFQCTNNNECWWCDISVCHANIDHDNDDDNNFFFALPQIELYATCVFHCVSTIFRVMTAEVFQLLSFGAPSQERCAPVNIISESHQSHLIKLTNNEWTMNEWLWMDEKWSQRHK